MTITSPVPVTTRPNSTSLQSDHHVDPNRDGFARRMVFAEFGYRDARMLDLNGFRDRLPTDEPIFATTISGRVK